MAVTTKSAVPAKARKAAKPAGIDPATTFEASGAIIEPGAKLEVDMGHPAIDANPRAGSTADMNRIDLNDPNKTDEEAVIDNLKANG